MLRYVYLLYFGQPRVK